MVLMKKVEQIPTSLTAMDSFVAPNVQQPKVVSVFHLSCGGQPRLPPVKFRIISAHFMT